MTYGRPDLGSRYFDSHDCEDCGGLGDVAVFHCAAPALIGVCGQEIESIGPVAFSESGHIMRTFVCANGHSYLRSAGEWTRLVDVDALYAERLEAVS